MINNRENPENHPIYSVDNDMDSSMLFKEVGPQKDEPEPEDSGSSESDYQSAETYLRSGSNDVPSIAESNNGWWHMSFDGAAGKKGVGVGIWIRPPTSEPKLLS